MQLNQQITRKRILSIDLLRGLIMIIMALDHVRDYFHQPAFITDPLSLQTTSPAIFFTRFITHFCAPTFVFLSGLSAFIGGQRKTTAELSRYLITRGCWLIIVEIVFMTLIMTFNPKYTFILLGVIWAIGCSMIILGLLVRGSYKLILAIGLIIFLGHNLLDYVTLPTTGTAFVIWRVFLTSAGSLIPLGSSHFALVAYAILPWTAIMLLGYSLGVIYKDGFDPVRRKKILWGIGVGLIVLFLLLRLPNLYGDPDKWSQQKNALYSLLSFLRVTKYPVSLQFACITLGPGLIFLAVSENWSNRFTRFAAVYGSVPLFYFVLHFFLIHIVCTIVFFATGHTMAQAVDPASIFLFRPAVFGFPLWIVYLIWIGIVLSLYYPCRWYGRYKRTHRQWWLSYL
jgi:uncharacterized membrane protein